MVVVDHLVHKYDEIVSSVHHGGHTPQVTMALSDRRAMVRLRQKYRGGLDAADADLVECWLAHSSSSVNLSTDPET